VTLLLYFAIGGASAHKRRTRRLSQCKTTIPHSKIHLVFISDNRIISPHLVILDIRGFLWLTNAKSVAELKKKEEHLGWKWWAGHGLSLFD